MVKEPVTKALAQFYLVEVYKFLNGEISEQQYVGKHGDKEKMVAWPEADWLNRNELKKFSILLQKLNVINRRNALHQSTRFTQDELRNLIGCGKSVVTAMIKPKNTRINSMYLALFAIIHRVPFTWVNCDDISFRRWDLHNFDHLEDLLLNKEDSKKPEKLIEKIQISGKWMIHPYIANISNKRLYLRIENAENVVIIDLLNSDTSNEYALLSVLRQTDYNWISLIYPSVVPGHYFNIFIGYNDVNILDTIISNQFPLVKEIKIIQFNNK